MKYSLLRGIAALALGLGLSVFSLTAGATVYTAGLSGAVEAPPNASPGTGTVLVDFDIDQHTLFIDVTFSGLLASTTAAHIHCCTAVPETGTAGVATQTPVFVEFPLGVTAGTYQHLFDTTDPASWNASFITANGGTTAGAEAALLAGLDAGTAYFNLHTQLFPSGEIRGFLQPVPEPATVVMLLAGAPLMLVLARRRKGSE